jgi:ribosomal protein L10
VEEQIQASKKIIIKFIIVCTVSNLSSLFMNWKHYINVIKKTLRRNGFNHLADEMLMAEVTAGKNANATLKEVISKLEQFKQSEQEAYGYIVSEAEALRRFAKSYGIEPSN